MDLKKIAKKFAWDCAIHFIGFWLFWVILGYLSIDAKKIFFFVIYYCFVILLSSVFMLSKAFKLSIQDKEADRNIFIFSCLTISISLLLIIFVIADSFLQIVLFFTFTTYSTIIVSLLSLFAGSFMGKHIRDEKIYRKSCSFHGCHEWDYENDPISKISVLFYDNEGRVLNNHSHIAFFVPYCASYIKIVVKYFRECKKCGRLEDTKDDVVHERILLK